MFSGPLIILVVHFWVLANCVQTFLKLLSVSKKTSNSIQDEVLFIWQRNITSHTLYSTLPFTQPVQGFIFCIRINLRTHIQISFCRSVAYSIVSHLVFVPLTVPIKAQNLLNYSSYLFSH